MKPKTPEQLNQLNVEAAEMMGWVEPIYRTPGRSNPYVNNRGPAPNGHKDMHTGAWNPTDKDSAQAQNYLIPRLIEEGLRPYLDYDMEEFTIKNKTFHQPTIISQLEYENPDEINACIVECCIEAMNKLKEIE